MDSSQRATNGHQHEGSGSHTVQGSEVVGSALHGRLGALSVGGATFTGATGTGDRGQREDRSAVGQNQPSRNPSGLNQNQNPIKSMTVPTSPVQVHQQNLKVDWTKPNGDGWRTQDPHRTDSGPFQNHQQNFLTG